jgi:hypothetical protein
VWCVSICLQFAVGIATACTQQHWIFFFILSDVISVKSRLFCGFERLASFISDDVLTVTPNDLNSYYLAMCSVSHRPIIELFIFVCPIIYYDGLTPLTSANCLFSSLVWIPTCHAVIQIASSSQKIPKPLHHNFF